MKTQEKRTIPTNIANKMKSNMTIKMKTAVISEPELDSQTSEVRRSTRTSRPVERLKPSMSGKLYVQNNKKKRRVSFDHSLKTNWDNWNTATTW
jgi:hypothetical protein